MLVQFCLKAGYCNLFVSSEGAAGHNMQRENR